MTVTSSIISADWSRKIYFGGLLLLVASLPLSKFAMSVAQFAILGSWLLSGNLKAKFNSFLHCKPAVAIVMVWLLHAVGLIWTTDFEYAFKDLRIKLPLLALPILFSSSPVLSRKQFEYILLALVAGTFAACVAGFITWMGWTGKELNDVRKAALFISHIRLSLLICLSVVVILWFTAVRHRLVLVLVPVALFMLGFLVILEALTGILILSVVLLFLGIRRSMFLESGYWKYILIVVSLALPLSVAWYIRYVAADFEKKEQVDLKNLETRTPSGNTYMHYTDLKDLENGHLVWYYICEEELLPQWNKRSDIDYKGMDGRGQELRFTLMRYMTSKGLRKDSAGVWALTNDDIRAVERGIANVHYAGKSSLYGRIHQVLWEIEHYRNGGNPSGHSLTMRWEYWKTALHIIQKSPLTGVGTGDLPDAYRMQYIEDRSQLTERWRLRAHNQFLSITVAFGVIGLLLFIWMLVYTLKVKLKQHDTLFLAFWLIAVLSMLTEDTLETQAGVTFFALFYGLFLFVNPQKRVCDGISGS